MRTICGSEKFLRRPRGLAVVIPLSLLAFFMCCTSSLQHAYAQGAPSAPSLEGKWAGALGSGANQLHLEVDFAKLPDGSYTGKLNSVDQGSILPVAVIGLTGNAVHFEIPVVGGVYQGTINSGGTEIAGTWQQTGGPPQKLDFHRAAAANAPTAPGPDEKPFGLLLDVAPSISPIPFAADSKTHLVYELHIANYGGVDCILTHIDVLASGPEEKILVSYSSAELEGIVTHPGKSMAVPAAKIAPGESAVAYIWVTLPSPRDVPTALRHRISAKVGNFAEGLTIVTSPLEVNRKPVVVINPPLRGDDWVSANGPSNTSVHRRALIPIDGRAVISQRFAIDWVRINANGQTYQGNRSDNKSYRAYGDEALAVADGVVTETKDGIPENVPQSPTRAVPITLETIGGNHVLLDLGGGVFAFYAHLQPGSLRVHVGDRVKVGQVLGLVGNSGNSSEPHLHFDLCDAGSMLGCEGLPYAFVSFDVQGAGQGWSPSTSKDSPVAHRKEMPLENRVVRFLSTPH